MPDDFDGDGHGHTEDIGGVATENNNGEFKGGSQQLGLHHNVVRMENQQYSSVLQSSIHAGITDTRDRAKLNTEILSELKTANWDSPEDYMDWCAAFTECERHGAPVDWLLRILEAKNAGLQGGRLRAVFDTISHTTITTNYMNPKQGGFSRLFRSRNNNDNGNQYNRNPITH